MPLYEYGCRACRRKIEKLVRADVPAIRCPHCGEPAERVPSTTGYRRDHTWD